MTPYKEHACHGGRMAYYSHLSDVLGCSMNVGVYLPPQAEEGKPLPALMYLAGLTCNEETFAMKGGAQQFAAQHGIVLISPDTSPRGIGINGEEDDWDFGVGAGFYIDATNGDWAGHYRMESYITRELQGLIKHSFPVDMDRQGIFGHSMGGHGALTLGLKYPKIYKSISAFAPICAPSQCPWGEKAFSGYLGDDRSEWKKHDAVELIHNLDKAAYKPILVDQGAKDEFLDVQLMPALLEQACEATNFPLTLRRHNGYDHSYYFMSTFMGDHIAHHARTICG